LEYIPLLLGTMEAWVLKSTGSWYEVMSEGKTFSCRLKGKIRLEGSRSTNPVSVGDKVDVEKSGEEYLITHIHDRKNYFVRRSVNLSKKRHVIAANMDQACIICSLVEPRTQNGFIDRFLATAEAYDIPAVVVFNKSDLYGEALHDELEYQTLMYRHIGYQVLVVSALTGQGMDEFAEMLRGKITLISGNSGVGKSTLINRIDPNLNLATKAVSESYKMGQHTTTFTEMFPLGLGGFIIDTPGIKSFGLVDMEREEIGDYFPEIFALKGGCRYNNCLHLNEPGCAVLQALENDEIAPTRYKSYYNIINGLEDEENN
jgi:ribosome biogenesis GTPase / thiamine phosphate phosphatase